jgi:hypothetical protein
VNFYITSVISAKDGTYVLSMPQISTSIPSGSVVTVPGTNAKFLIPAGLGSTALTNQTLMQLINSSQGLNTITSSPARASSAPPINNVKIHNLVRSASGEIEISHWYCTFQKHFVVEFYFPTPTDIEPLFFV